MKNTYVAYLCALAETKKPRALWPGGALFPLESVVDAAPRPGAVQGRALCREGVPSGEQNAVIENGHRICPGVQVQAEGQAPRLWEAPCAPEGGL